MLQFLSSVILVLPCTVHQPKGRIRQDLQDQRDLSADGLWRMWAGVWRRHRVRSVFVMKIRPFQPEDTAAVITLWSECGLLAPQNDPAKDIDRKMQVDPGGFLVGEADGRIIAACMAGYEGHRGWINYLAVSPEHRRRGLGRQIMAAAEDYLKTAGCPKINLQVRAANTGVMAFYAALGFVVDDVVSMGKRLVAD